VSDEDLKDLGHLPMDELMAERVRRRAQAVLAGERGLIGHPVKRKAARAWWAAEPVLLAAACIIYLLWAFDFTSKLYN
jgi:hypothetical protein